LKYLFRRDTKEETGKELHNTIINVQGIILYHPVLLNSPWEAPDDLDDQTAKLLLTTEPILMTRAERANKEGDGDNRDKDNEQTQMATTHLSIKSILLERIYKITSHTFHVAVVAQSNTACTTLHQPPIHSHKRRMNRPYNRVESAS
jgi:hypothetical protein